MPHYFFHTRKDNHVPDTVEAYLPDIDKARVEAAEIMAHELRDHPREFWTDEEWRIDVTDDRGLILFTVYSAAIRSAACGG